MRSTLQRLDRYVALVRVEDAVHLGAAGVHQVGEARLGNTFALHLLGKLPGDDALDRGGGCFLADAFLVEEVLERRSPMGIGRVVAHRSISIIRRRASARSSGGVRWVFLMKP